MRAHNDRVTRASSRQPNPDHGVHGWPKGDLYMTTRCLLGNSLALFATLSLACSDERSIAPVAAGGPPALSRQSLATTRFYAQHNFVSDGAVLADVVDTALVNAWGLVAGPTTPWWVSDNGTDS